MINPISTGEAAKIVGVGLSTIRAKARKEGWLVERMERSDGGTPRMYFECSDVEAFADERAKRIVMTSLRRQEPGDAVKHLVEWADGLTEWPTDEEINAQISETYRYRDIVSVLENRHEREKQRKVDDFTWEMNHEQERRSSSASIRA